MSSGMNAELRPSDARTATPVSILIGALGGQGGGVLAEWLVDAATRAGYVAQGTSIPGVAQRTGATNYYLELFPKAEARARGRAPVLGLVPVPGDVDIVIASELMEAGRAVQRGLVTPDRTTLIASTHRVFAMTEKIALADGRADADALLRGANFGAPVHGRLPLDGEQHRPVGHGSLGRLGSALSCGGAAGPRRDRRH